MSIRGDGRSLHGTRQTKACSTTLTQVSSIVSLIYILDLVTCCIALQIRRKLFCRYGKAMIFDMGDTDLTDAIKVKWNGVKVGLWKKILDRTILDPEK